MPWRETLRYGGPEARRIHDAAFPHAPLDPDTDLRITFEECVSECCKRWRGPKNVYEVEGMCPLLHSFRAAFCPECGRKLETRCTTDA
jgi:hypothetical protein